MQIGVAGLRSRLIPVVAIAGLAIPGVFALSLARAGVSGAATYIPVPASTMVVSKTVKGTNGYRLSVIKTGGSVTVQGGKGPLGVSATVPSSGAVTRVKAGLGPLGKVSMRFSATGRPKKVPVPRRCTGRAGTSTPGVLTGTFRFIGENGFTRVNVTRVKADLRKTRKMRCRHVPSPGASRNYIFSLTAADRMVMAQRPETGGRAYFHAMVNIRIGRVDLDYSAKAQGPRSTFPVNYFVTRAILKPPAPFHGTLASAGPFPIPGGATGNRVTGDLSVKLANRQRVTLSRVGGTWVLVKGGG